MQAKARFFLAPFSNEAKEKNGLRTHHICVIKDSYNFIKCSILKGDTISFISHFHQEVDRIKKRNFISFLKAILLMQFFFAAIIVGLSVDLQSISLKGWSGIRPDSILMAISGPGLNAEQAALLVRESNLLMAGMDEKVAQDPGGNYLKNASPEKIICSNIQAIACMGSLNPAAVVASSEQGPVDLPAIVSEQSEPETEESAIVFRNDNQEIFKNNKVYFYCTHSAETYIPDSGQAKLEGKRGLVNRVAQHIADECKRYGLETIFNDTIHDSPEYDKSYTNSRETVKTIVNNDAKIIGLFDIHRDSIPGTKQAPRLKIEGKSSASILIIVGTDERKPHPGWKTNYAFANKLLRQSDKMYPGLIRGVRTKAGTYNQEFNNHALLLEFGSDYNTLEEANYAAELFARVLIEVLKEEMQAS